MDFARLAPVHRLPKSRHSEEFPGDSASISLSRETLGGLANGLFRQAEGAECIAIERRDSRSRCACTASSGFMWTAFMNHRGSYDPIGSSARSGGPRRSRISRKTPQ